MRDVLEYVPNLRDLGGIPTSAGGKIRHGALLRSAMPDAADIVLEGTAWPPAVVIDLRSPGEHEEIHPLVSHGATVHVVPLLTALDPTRGWALDLRDLYMRMLDEASPLLVELVDIVARGGTPTLVHCAAGKDRTGVAIAMLLRLVGVEREHVVDDYMVTLAAEADISRRLTHGPGVAHRVDLPPAFLEVPVEAIEAVLDHWDDHHGGVEGWLVDAGAGRDVLGRVRDLLVEH